MTTKELLYVKTIAKECSISKAAKKLYMAQPSLSQSLQRIEESLGAQLFNRTAAGLVLTYAGERYCAMAGAVLKICEDFETEISDINELKTGRVHLGITAHLGTVLLPMVLPRFKELCPYIDLQITEENSTVLESRLLDGSLDFCIMHAPKEAAASQLEYEHLTKDPFLLVVPKGHPIKAHTLPSSGPAISGTAAFCTAVSGTAAPVNIHPSPPHPAADLTYLRGEDFIMLYEPQRIRQVADSVLKKAGIPSPRIYLTVRNFETALRLAASGIGVTLLPSQYISILSAEDQFDTYSIPESYDATWTLSIATCKGSYLSKADHLFLDLIRACYAPSRPEASPIS